MAVLGNVLAVVVAVNAVFILGQLAALEINPEGPVYYHCEGTLLGDFEANNCTGGVMVLDDTDPASVLPSTGGSVSVDTGNDFTDTYGVARGWFNDVPGFSFLKGIFTAPSSYLKAMGVPASFAAVVSIMWWGFTVLIVVAFVLGRDY
jgi:hypothetical protein